MRTLFVFKICRHCLDNNMAFRRLIVHMVRSNLSALNSKSLTVIKSSKIFMRLEGYKLSRLERVSTQLRHVTWKPRTRWKYGGASLDAMDCADVRQLFITGFWVKCVSIVWHPSVPELSVILSSQTCIVCKECQYVTLYRRCKFSPKNSAECGWCWVSFGRCVKTGKKLMSHRLTTIGWSSPKMRPDGF